MDEHLLNGKTINLGFHRDITVLIVPFRTKVFHIYLFMRVSRKYAWRNKNEKAVILENNGFSLL